MMLSLIVAGVAISVGDLGDFSPTILLAHLPLFAAQRIPMRALLLASLGISLLCARGLDRLRAGTRGTRSLLATSLTGGTLLAAAACVAWRWQFLDARRVAGVAFLVTILALVLSAARLPRRARLVAGTAIVALAAADRFDDVWSIHGGQWPATYGVEHATRPPPPGLREVLVEECNDSLLTGRLSAWGYDPVIPMRTAMLWNQACPGLYELDGQGRLVTAWPVLRGSELLTPAAIAILERMGVSRLHLPATTQPPPQSGSMTAHVLATGRPGEYLLPPARRARLLGSGVPLAVRDTDPGTVEIDIPEGAPPSGATVELSDASYPGWIAAVDGVPCAVTVAETAFRAVSVPGGARHVVFRYRPFSFRLGLFGTGLGILAFAFGTTHR